MLTEKLQLPNPEAACAQSEQELTWDGHAPPRAVPVAMNPRGNQALTDQAWSGHVGGAGHSPR